MTPQQVNQSTTDAARELLSPEFIRKIEQLQLVARKVFTGRMRGERRSKKKGVSIEFADYRDYVRGDDLRFIDWNIYSRLDRLFLKLFMEELDLYFYILIDTSRSMGLGEPNKLLYAKRVAAALGYIGLANLDKVGITAFRGTEQLVFSPTRGKARTWAMLRFLAGLEAQGTTDLQYACKHFALRNRLPGVVVLISDLLDPKGYEEALKFFLHRNFEAYIIHLLGEDEINPKLAGHLELVDSETDDRTEVTVNQALLRRYKQMLDAYCTAVKNWATAHGMIYMATSTATAFDQLILNYLRRRGLLR